MSIYKTVSFRTLNLCSYFNFSHTFRDARQIDFSTALQNLLEPRLIHSSTTCYILIRQDECQKNYHFNDKCGVWGNLSKISNEHILGLTSFKSAKANYSTNVQDGPGCGSVLPVSMSYSSFKSTSSDHLSTASPIVIMHGLLGSRLNWRSLAKVINQKTKRTVYTVDARNHGESPHSHEFDYYHLAEDLIYFLKEHSIPRACLIGHSMGGRAVMALSLLKPDVVDKLFVLDISPIAASESISTLPKFVEVMRNVNIPAELQLHEARKYVDNILIPFVPESAVRAFLLSNLMKIENEFSWKVNLAAVAQKFNPHISTFPIGKEGKSFEGKTYFIGGAHSDYIRRSDHDEIRKIFPKAEFSYLEGAGHWLHSDKPQEFLKLLLPLLSS